MRSGVAGLAAVALLAACGSNGSEGSDGLAAGGAPGATPVVSVAPATPEPSLSAADYVLTPGAETAGYRAGETPEDDSGSGNQSDSDDLDLAEVASCLGIDESAFDDAGTIDEANGPDFTAAAAEFPTVSSDATVATAEIIAEQGAIFTDPDFAACFGTVFERQLAADGAQDGLTYEVVATETIAPPPGANGAMRLSFGITSAGQTFGFVMDAVFVYRDRVGVSLLFLNQEAPTPPEDIALMVSQIDAKLDQQ